MSEVAHLPRRDELSLIQAPALGFSLQVDLGAGRVCTLQTHVASDCSLRDLNMMLDKMTAAGDRQRAHYKIEELERDLKQTEKEQAQHQEDLDRVDREHEAAQAKRQASAEAAVKALGEFEKVVAARHEERGGRGPVVLKGHDKANYDRVASSVTKLKAEMANAQSERDVAHANSKTVFDRRAEIIAKMQAEIAHCKEIVADGLK